jgi:hypothetical protein
MAKDKHVISRNGGWAVRTAGALKAARIFDTKAKAVSYAKDFAKRARSTLYVHRRDGMVAEMLDYGSDP